MPIGKRCDSIVNVHWEEIMHEVPGLNPTLIRSSPWFDPHLGDALNLSATRAVVTAPTKPTFFQIDIINLLIGFLRGLEME